MASSAGRDLKQRYLAVAEELNRPLHAVVSFRALEQCRSHVDEIFGGVSHSISLEESIFALCARSTARMMLMGRPSRGRPMPSKKIA
jgi:hypothetical protein